MIKIYHNPRCSKSREGLGILEKSKSEYEIVEYLKTIPTEAEIKEIVSLLQIKPEQLVRKNEIIWKEHYKGKRLSDNELIKIMVEHPKLIERPIVINGNKAVVGRPPEIIKTII